MKGKITEEKYISAKQFIINKSKQIHCLHETFNNLSSTEKSQFRIKLEKIKNEMCDYFLKIIWCT